MEKKRIYFSGDLPLVLQRLNALCSVGDMQKFSRKTQNPEKVPWTI
jgi:hypothetical protein